jgi:hypothetical protein
MKNVFILCTVLVIFAGLLIGCSQETNTGSTTGGREYFPNTDGYSWTYRVSSPATTETATMKFTAAGTTTAGGVTVQKIRAEMTYGSSVSTMEALVRVTETDVSLYSSVTVTTPEVSKMIAFPLSVGSSWIVYRSASVTQEASVVAQENITVPAGSYTGCFKMRMPSFSLYGASTIETWLAKNVGVVKVLMTSLYGTIESVGLYELTAKSF